MARKIIVTLTLNNTTVETLEELKKNFDIEALIVYFKNGGLYKFLKSRGYNNYATRVLIIKKNDKDLIQKLYKIFEINVPIEELQNIDVEKAVKRKNNQNRLKVYTNDEKILSKAENAAFDQKDLDELISSGVSEIYLCNGKFIIPLDAHNKTYIGVGDVIAIINSEKLIDFDALNIHFKKISFDENYKKLQNSPVAMYEFGKYYYDAKDYKKSFEWYEKSANAGSVGAMCILGICYRGGLGVEQDYKKSFEWYEKAANAGQDYAMNKLGICYYYGWGVAQDYQKAIEWFKKAAEAGNEDAKKSLAEAMYNFGTRYYNGEGVAQDYKKAFEWYEKAANAGYAIAMFGLGACYYYGRGIAQDYKKAFEWYEKSVNAGYADAMFELGTCYNYGEGVAQDYKKAFEWYEKAATAGNDYAMYNLGICYYHGNGVDQDYKKAMEWFKKAAEAGNEDAKKRLAELGY